MDGENSVPKQRGRPFKPGQSGNPAGKPKGARNRSTIAAELLLEGEARALTRKAIELGLAGDQKRRGRGERDWRGPGGRWRGPDHAERGRRSHGVD